MSAERIRADGAFDHRAALTTLYAHAIEGLEHVDAGAGSLTRLVEVGGDVHALTVRLDSGGATLLMDTGDAGVVREVAGRVRRWFDLGTDIRPVDEHLGSVPPLAAQVAARPGVRITRFADPFEAVVRVILGQQVSLTAARTFGARLVIAHGTGAPGAAGASGLRRFPTPAAVAATPVADLRASLGLTGARARTVRAASALFAEAGGGGVEPPPRDLLAGVPGIGPWTLDLLAIRCGTDRDVFPASDAVLRRVLRAAGVADPPTASAAWSPYRSYAAVRLWAMAAGGPAASAPGDFASAPG